MNPDNANDRPAVNAHAPAVKIIEIDRGLPVPAKRAKYPWEKMEVGDSFLFPAGLDPNSARNSARFASRDSKKFITRSTSDGMRCWRVE